MAFQTVLVQAFASELVTLGQHLRADTLIEMDIVITLHHRRTKRLAGTVGDGSAHGNARHTFNAAADGDVIAAGDHALRGKMNGLLAGSALTIDRGSGDGFGESRSKNSVAPDVSCLLADLHNAAG